MEMNASWITCRMGKKLYLLAKDEIAYYLIEVGKNLDYATEEWLEKQGVSEILLKELQLPFIYIPKSNLRGVAITGNEAGEYIYLYLKSEKKKLMLELDYDSDWMEDFFFGIPRFAAPQSTHRKKKSDDWRKEKQNPELLHKLRFVVPVCFALNACASAGFVLTAHWAWFTLCLILLAGQTALLIGMPAYFAFPVSKKKKTNAWELDIPLDVMFIILLLRFRMNTLSDKAFWISAAIGIAVAFVIYLFLKDLHEDKWAPLGVVLLGALAGWYFIGHANEVYAFSPTEKYVLMVEDTRKSGGKRDSYYCTVTLPDGREVDLQISRIMYNDLEEGDYVRVEVGEGFFGIEYANVYSAE